MSNQINDGGPAFPTTATATTVSKREDGASVLTNYGSSPGMTLRDFFAAAALQGILSSPQTAHSMIIANAAYKAADAMLRAREAK